MMTKILLKDTREGREVTCETLSQLYGIKVLAITRAGGGLSIEVADQDAVKAKANSNKIRKTLEGDKEYVP